MLDSTFSPYPHPPDMSAIVKSMFMGDTVQTRDSQALRVDKAIDEDSRMILTHGKMKSDSQILEFCASHYLY